MRCTRCGASVIKTELYQGVLKLDSFSSVTCHRLDGYSRRCWINLCVLRRSKKGIGGFIESSERTAIFHCSKHWSITAPSAWCPQREPSNHGAAP